MKLISSLKEGEVFVFGSNLAGIHGAGAARTALKWGAVYGKGIGLQGNTYAIPTKDKNIKTLPLTEIKNYVSKFTYDAKSMSNLTFLVTEIGCGLAGYSAEDIAPFFEESFKLKNVVLPLKFIKIINNEKLRTN